MVTRLNRAPCLILLIFLSINAVFSTDDHVEVKLKQGSVLGKVETTFLNKETYYKFQSIPYAQPPVGSLRFQVSPLIYNFIVIFNFIVRH